ncbi:hypothetical protein Q4603_09595 [Zobellia galactanivorans]|uniref:Hypothetical membrane protein n=1 Tax=Zobellia galactanivorans (strain DSM 12802 / CCUG 47099 / CIP 106680 / NCIMB 13871 / Dsij) TaxID=63186 RepID=G0L6L4_ZOBGA|nr:hypothetical protein [Zobellia galactanivorans]MDO6808865.1 hypothetical protein [Zobellia galactanivorans]CAZ98490.1 Hypothetical membrane protein [Zobellia galactanivorans]
MDRQGNELNKEQYIGAPIERAHLHRGFNSKKTPVKWIRFFRACVLQREIAQEKKKKKIKKIWFIFLGIFIGTFITSPLTNISPAFKILPVTLGMLVFPGLIVAIIMTYRTNKKFKRNFAEGFDFFADYFSALFTLIEEDLQVESKIALEANLKHTITKENLIKNEAYTSETRGFIKGEEEHYERVISKGSCLLYDESLVFFQFTERTRKRIILKRGSSGKRKTKHKYRAAYPFTIKMKIPKHKYQLNPSVDTKEISFVEDDAYYVFKVSRKFDVKKENPEQYNPYKQSSITAFAVDYFSLEVINLINTCYSCVTPSA